MNQSQIHLNLSKSVFHSVVAVEDRNREEFWVGSVIHKFCGGVFILTQSKFLRPNFDLVVHFHDNSEAKAYLLVSGPSPFAVLYLETNSMSTAIRFRDQNFSFSEAVCIIPKSETTFQSIPGFVPVPSCESNGANGANNESGSYFLFMFHQEDTPTITPAPIFHKDEDVIGFVVRDCAMFRDPNKVDVHMKICLKSTEVVAWLRGIVHRENWKLGLEKICVPLREKLAAERREASSRR